MRHPLTLLFFLLSSLTAFAQTGTIRGTVKDATTQEPLIGASVGVVGTSLGASTDLDGGFTVSNVPEGTYSLAVSSVSYEKKTIPGLTVAPGKVVVVNTALSSSSQSLGEVVVTAQRRTNTEVAVISEVRNAQLVAVGVSAEQIVKSQDRDAAQVARRVPGVSIADNRFILVRGLTQRYNAVMLNDVLTPSSEVDTRAFSFDMIPSSVIDRMLIYKSGSAELPGDFAGGVIKVYTKRAPEENFTNLSVLGGYRAGTTGKSVQQTQRGKLDFIGFGDGDRAIPNSWPGFRGLVRENYSNQQRAELANQLPNTWGLQSKTVAPDLRMSFNMGRRFELGEKQAGTLTSINYANYHQQADVSLRTYEVGNNNVLATDYRDNLYDSEVRVGVVQNFWLRLNARNTLEFKNLFNQLGTSETVVREGANNPSSTDERSYSQRFESRSIYSGQLVGQHELANYRTKIGWASGFSYTLRKEPDWRRVRYTRPLANAGSSEQSVPYSVAIPVNPVLTDAGRYFSNLNERVVTLTGDLTHALGLLDSVKNESKFKLKAGFYAERKDRDFTARFFGYQGIGPATNNSRTLPVGEVFAPANVTGNTGGLSLEEGTTPDNRYTASNTLAAAYASLTLPLGKFIGTAGFRGEYNDQRLNGFLYTGPSVTGGQKLFSPLPSLNLTYNLNDKSLVRAAYASTINRPEFRELAPFIFYDFNLNSVNLGNTALKTATIQNVDLRWELYPSTNEQITVGAFYKHFNNAIESYLLQTAGGPTSLNYAFTNSKEAITYGVEAEVRKSLVGLTESLFLQRLSFVGNASYLYSRINLGERILLPTQSGSVTEATPDESQRDRALQNQSPYLINLNAYYTDEERGTQISLLYNVAGPRIFAVGNDLVPNVYEAPRNVLDLVVTQRIRKNWELRAAYQDIFNQRVRLVQDVNRNARIDSNDLDVRVFRRGSYGTLGLTYSF
ncbi:TonB-dependent receptor [Hymenobacter aerilatus]|uniref:TonB-dependent receptor n=1 Tax=Hymenobacter aerilatus TaxID=2932251 RepID=A0A8T9T2L9_9BACT|nr:TonB-dependent receptor [Hymenobacter aerilatus]UOR06356.1 TonB-dependent receptor [Hymenobacter aerilatus]